MTLLNGYQLCITTNQRRLQVIDSQFRGQVVYNLDNMQNIQPAAPSLCPPVSYSAHHAFSLIMYLPNSTPIYAIPQNIFNDQINQFGNAPKTRRMSDINEQIDLQRKHENYVAQQQVIIIAICVGNIFINYYTFSLINDSPVFGSHGTVGKTSCRR